MRPLPAAAMLLTVGSLAAGCGQLNRSATLGSYATNKTVSGVTVAAELEQQLAKRGLPVARVACVHRVIVDVGAMIACALRGAGTRHTVVFRFDTPSGVIDTASIKTS